MTIRTQPSLFTLIVSRFLSYALLIAAAFAAMAGIFFSPLPHSAQYALLSTLLMLSIFFSHPIHLRIQALAKKKWAPNQYDPIKLIQELTSQLHMILPQKDLLSTATQVLIDHLELTHIIAALVVGPRTLDVIIFSWENHALSSVYKQTLDIDSLKDFPPILLQHEEFQQNLHGYLRLFDQPESELYVPIMSGQILEGFWCLGKRVSQQPFSKNDIDVLITVAKQTAIAIHRADPYEKIKSEYDKKRHALSFEGALIAFHHDIISPLTSIRLCAQTLRKEPELSTKSQSFLAVILDHAQKIADVLQHLRLSSELEHRTDKTERPSET